MFFLLLFLVVNVYNGNIVFIDKYSSECLKCMMNFVSG